MKLAITVLLFACNMLSSFAQNVLNIESGGNTIHVKTFGEGLPVLIINGGPGMSSEGFIPLARKIGESNKAIIYDQRGTGLSVMKEVSANTVTMDLMVEDIESIRKHLNIKQWVVFGHSFGGMLGAYYTSKYPQNVKGLILSSSGGVDLSLLSSLSITGRLTAEQQDSLTYWNNRISDGDTTYHAAYQRGKFLAPAYLYDKSHVNTIAERLTQGNRNINTLVWQNMRAMDFDCKEGLRKFKKPVLIIQGEQDLIDISIAKTTKALFVKSELVLIPECAHYGWLEQPDEYFGALNFFLDSLDAY